jgi:hypothetical protein
MDLEGGPDELGHVAIEPIQACPEQVGLGRGSPSATPG